jgi:hypothetical protein
MKPKKPPKISRADLERKVRELEAQLPSMLHFASRDIQKTVDQKGSGIVIQMHYLGGRAVCRPFFIKDGLSPTLVAAFQEDMRRTWDEATELKPVPDKIKAEYKNEL